MIAYSLSGADAALFSINTTTGVVTFNAAPDFEAPADSDANNVYNIDVNASDGSLTTTMNVDVTVTDEQEQSGPEVIVVAQNIGSQNGAQIMALYNSTSGQPAPDTPPIEIPYQSGGWNIYLGDTQWWFRSTSGAWLGPQNYGGSFGASIRIVYTYR